MVIHQSESPLSSQCLQPSSRFSLTARWRRGIRRESLGGYEGQDSMGLAFLQKGETYQILERRYGSESSEVPPRPALAFYCPRISAHAGATGLGKCEVCGVGIAI